MKENRVILWIPTPQRLGSTETSDTLCKALEEQGILHEQLFYPTKIMPRDFPSGQDIGLDVDVALGFSFKSLLFEESKTLKGTYNISENSLLVPVKLMGIHKYSPVELAAYFRKCWLPLSENLDS